MEAKLIELPVGYPILVAELRRFEEERDCQAVEIRAGPAEFLSVCALVARVEDFGDVRVRVDEEVRAGHVVLVGGESSYSDNGKGNKETAGIA